MTGGPRGRPADGSEGGPLSAPAQWAVLAVLVVSLVVIPVAILLWPPTFLPFHDAYLALALVPGLVLGATAVAITLRAGR